MVHRDAKYFMTQSTSDQIPGSADRASATLVGEVISIGDEMTSGARLDTNTQWLSRRLGELGVVVKFHGTVGDTLSDNEEVFRIAAQRSDVILCTGGLGPTRDDLTREALAGVVDRPLVMRASALEHIESLFSRRHREMPPRNQVQAMFPEGSDEIYNPQGTAPGIDLVIPVEGRQARLFALPGVPAEMKKMFDETVAPRILQIASGGGVIRHRVMKFFGTGESDMEERLGEMISRERKPRVGITVSAATISLRISMTGESEKQCDEAIARTADEILDRVGEFYFGEGESFEQQNAIEQSLLDRKEKLAVVEFGRAAPLGDWFASLGETEAFCGGLSLAKRKDLESWVEPGVGGGAFEALCQRTGADWLLVVDQYPELQYDADRPMPATEVLMEVWGPGGKRYPTKVTLGGHPSIVQPRIAKTAMSWLRQCIAESG